MDDSSTAVPSRIDWHSSTAAGFDDSRVGVSRPLFHLRSLSSGGDPPASRSCPASIVRCSSRVVATVRRIRFTVLSTTCRNRSGKCQRPTPTCSRGNICHFAVRVSHLSRRGGRKEEDRPRSGRKVSFPFAADGATRSKARRDALPRRLEGRPSGRRCRWPVVGAGSRTQPRLQPHSGRPISNIVVPNRLVSGGGANILHLTKTMSVF
jgi:hypothetical protein